jgi:hypothetical protein
MKHRNGFVSNSSSSSFIVAFPKGTVKLPKEKMKARLKKLLFDKDEFVGKYSVDEVLDTLHRNISSEDDSAIVQIKCTCPHCGKDVGGVIVDSEYNENEPRWKYEKETVMDFVRGNPDSDICFFMFSDEDGDYYGMLEHGDIFHNVPNIVVSHH